MKLKKFIIKNYKSITDSGDCYLTDTITILAGKNESGKTSILEEIKSPLKATADIEIELIKTFPDSYSFGESTLQNEIFGGKEIEKNRKSIKDKWNKIKAIQAKYEALGGSLFDFEFSDFANEKTLFTNFKNATTPNVAQIDEKERDNFSKLLTEIETEINNLENFFATETKFLNALKQWIPNFILFNSFEDIFPNKIPFAELEKNEWIKDLSVISDLKITTIKGTDDRGKEKHKDDINIKLNKDYEKFWTQDVSNLSVNWDSEHLYFWIKEDGYPFEPSLRSKGRQWHLAFYIKVPLS